jgi:hypothetical protein
MLPQIDDPFYQLSGFIIFSKIELRYGYHQVQIKYEETHKTTFMTRYGKDEFMVVPFGLTNAPTTFMCLMNTILSKYLDIVLLVFIDDILIYYERREENEEHLKLVLQVLREHKLYAKFSKYDLFSKMVHYLGHVIIEKGVVVEPDNIKSMMYLPTQRDLSDIKYFMGLAGYYMRFIKGLFMICFPITSL